MSTAMSETKRVACVDSNCGTFPMDSALFHKLQRTGETFHCPEGHAQHFSESRGSQLEERINELESKVQRHKRRAKKNREQLHEVWDDYSEQKQRRKFAESRLLDYAKGVVEVGEERFRWSCQCDSRGQKTFGDVDNAKDAFKEHRRRRCTVEDQGEVTVNVE